MVRRFRVGQRVITKPQQPIYPKLTGYYGHVVHVEDQPDIGKGQLVFVQFLGRVRGDFNRAYSSPDGWPCWADEIEAVD